MKSFFISFEGPDGSGKSTVLEQVVAQIAPKLRVQYLVTREPGGSKIAEQIRQFILDPANIAMSAKTEALLYAASRSQHMAETIIPALEKGQVVFSDRFVDSSLAYQGVGRDLGIEAVKAINDFATSGIEPDVTIFLDVQPEVGLARIAKDHGGQEDRLEQEKLSFHQKVYQGYQWVNQQYSDRIEIVNANRPLSQVVADCVKIVVNRLPKELLKD
ncbi:dTMP kinase [Lactobacillus sp. ESL0703]|uniref:dTMP kinase n=1 Tax=Lactobacillus sp. ESL0703 TaxID=2983218 RepID=UPI0023F65C58|nr:dTMP kinase [Lactobacillus sp. ESL0703]MDF7669039.1 dTMP kinase [Lactobacillus sp. ESL0703]